MTMPTIDHPSHYQSAGTHGAAGNIEVIDVIESYGFGASFSLGNALKYLLRAGKKGHAVADLEKAKWYVLHHDRDGLGDEPIADESALERMDPETVCTAFALAGAQRTAVELVLGWAAYGLESEVLAAGGDIEQSECDLIAAAIDEAILEAKQAGAAA